jgi:hypothetical protein
MVRKSALVRAGVIAPLVLVGTVLAGAVAHADEQPPEGEPPTVQTPYGCDFDYIDNYRGASAMCDLGDGLYRIKIRCDKNNWPDYDRYGPWRSPFTTPSTAYCNTGDKAYGATIQYG